MTNEQKTQNLFLSTNWNNSLSNYKRGIVDKDDEYRVRKDTDK